VNEHQPQLPAQALAAYRQAAEHRALVAGDGKAGASAMAMYRQARRASRLSRWSLQAAAATGPGMLAWWAAGWQAGLATGATGAAAAGVWVWRRCAEATWRRGAVGERRTARALARLRRAGYVVLHDRALPGSRANVDHLLIGPSGIWVVDSKRWHRKTGIRGRHGQVWVGRTPAERVVNPVKYETQVVANVLGAAVQDAGLEVGALIAVHGARMPWGGVVVEQVPLLRPRKAVRVLLQAPPILNAEQVEVLARVARRELPAVQV
jgi:hypothetical protein